MPIASWTPTQQTVTKTAPQVAGKISAWQQPQAKSPVAQADIIAHPEQHIYNPLVKNNQIDQTIPQPNVLKETFKPSNLLEATKKVLPGAAQTVNEIKSNPLSTGHATLPQDVWKAVTGPLQAEKENIKALIDSGKRQSVSERGGASLKVIAGAGGVLFSPISALFAGANDIPILGTVSKLITVPFSAMGDAGAGAGNAIVDKLPISQEAKNQIKPGIEQIFALAGQLVLGKVGLDVKAWDALKAKFGEADATTIATKAQELANQKTGFETKPVPDIVPTPVESKPAEGFVTKPVSDTNYTRLISQREYDALQKTGSLPANPDNQTLIIKPGQESQIKGVGESKQYRATFNSSIEDKITSSDTPMQASVTGPIGKEHIASVEPITKVTKAASDINENLVKKGFDNIPESEQAKYTTMTKADQIAKITEFMSKNLEEAKGAAKGELPIPHGILPQPLFNAMEEYATKNNDVQLLRDLAKSPIATQLSEAGQTLGSHGFNDNPNSSVSAMREVAKAREKAIEKKTGKSIKENTKSITESIKKEVGKTHTKETWSSFVESLKC